jgi:signal transduction histidine kinase
VPETRREKLNILLVDDQPAKLLSYETILGELDETLIKANSARAALELLLRHEIALILIDVCMPELDGFELAQMIRQHPRYQTVAIIFVSAVQVTDHDLVRGYEQGAVDYVPVPVAPGLLRAKVRVFVELYRKTKQLERFNAELERRVEERTGELAAVNAALARTNEDLERRVEERTREHESALAKMHQLQKLDSLGQLTGGVAHDFNNLLMAIQGHLELALRSLPKDSRAKRLLESAMQGAERGAALTKRMLAFARRQDLKPERVDVVALIGSMTEMLDRSLGPLVEIRTEFAATSGLICVDPNQLELALLNLGLNARDAMQEGGTLTIRISIEELPIGRHVCIAVTDTGRGMDETTQKRAAEPFFTTKGLGKGTGLGLSIVDGLAAQSGGQMRISSRIGIGTKVELLFPLETAAALPAPTIVVPDAVEPEQSYSILLVDDDALVSMSTAAMIEELGHSVVEASSVAEALEILRSDLPIDCVITDQAMPGTTGIVLANMMREHWPTTPVILATGYADLPESEIADLPRLAKPYRLSALADVLSQVLRGKEPALRAIGPAQRAAAP